MMTSTIAALIGLPPPIALLGSLCFVWYLFARDLRQGPDVTRAIWLPIIWVVLMGSHSVSQWLAILHLPISLGAAEEGNPLDAFVYLLLIVGGLNVLSKRQVNLTDFVNNNGWVVGFLLYCFIAIIWSDFPFVAFKRWIKVLGHPVMALVLLSEPNPSESIARLMKRSAYLLLTFSIVAIKWFPDIGRNFDEWTGLAVNVGITQSKNMLGCSCLILGLFFVWSFMKVWGTEKSRARRDELRLLALLLLMDAYLLRKSHDATATLCLLMAVTVVFLAGRRWLNKKLIGVYLATALVGLVIAEFAFGLFERIGELTGHSSTLMGRMELWRQCLALHTNPVFGVGFESFWLGDRLHLLKEGRPWQPNEAHNGYLETYLNLGIVGLLMLFALLTATFRKIYLELLDKADWARFQLGFLIALIFYNLTEATFKGLSLPWFIFFIVAIKYPRPEYEASAEASVAVEEEGLVYTEG